MRYLRTDGTSSILHQSPGRTGSREDKHWLAPSRLYLRTCAHSPSSKNAHSLEPGFTLHPAALRWAARLDCEVFSCLNAARPQETIEARRAWLALLENAFPTSLPSAELATCGVFRAWEFPAPLMARRLPRQESCATVRLLAAASPPWSGCLPTTMLL